MNSEPIEDLDVPPLSSYTVTELRQLFALTSQTYEAYKAQDTDAGRIGAKLCLEEMNEIEVLLNADASGNPPPASPPSCTQDTVTPSVQHPAQPTAAQGETSPDPTPSR